MDEGWAMPICRGELVWYGPASSVSMPQAFSSETVSDPLASHSGWKLLDWRTTPESVARRLAHQPGFVWLDSSLPAPKAKSLLTARPSRVLRGNIAYDWDQIDAALQQTTCSRTVTAASPDACSWSPSGLYGWVGFDGRFVFGEYKHALL